MTEEQINDLWLQLEYLHPEQFKRLTTLYDEDYDKEEAEAIEDGEGVLWEDVEVEPFARADPGGVLLEEAEAEQPGEDQWEDVPYL